jgi:uncharacterized membrane protein
MKLNKKDLLILIIRLIIPLIIAAAIYPILPAQIPRQFGLNGEVRYMAKEFIFLLGMAPFLIYKYRQLRGK